MICDLKRTVASCMALCLAWAGSSRVTHAITPDNPGPADVRLTVNSLAASAKPISPYIYGMNFFAGITSWTASRPRNPRPWHAAQPVGA